MDQMMQPQGMMSGGVTPAPQPSTEYEGAYNGTVDVMGTPVEVKNGAAEVKGQRFFVSNNGMVVVNEKKQIVGFVEGGKFKKNTPEHIELLKAQGLIEGSAK